MFGFEFTEKQAQSIVDMRLRALTSLELNKLQEEYDELTKKIAYFKEILGDDKKLYAVIKDELLEITSKEKDERSTNLIEEETEDFEVEDLVEESSAIVTMTHFGYIKRMEPDTFKTQSRGGRGIKAMSTTNDDFIEEVFMTTMHSNLMFISNLGKMYTLKGHQIPEANRTSKGTAIVNILKLDGGEKIAAGVDCKTYSEDKFLVFATKKGVIKKVRLSEFEKVRSSGLKAINIKEGDELIAAKITNGNDDIFLITKNGLCLRINENKIREMGRTASGVRGINVKNDDELISMLVTNEGKELLLVSETGIGKRTNSDEFAVKGRGGKGMICYKPSERTGKLVGAELVNGDEDIMIINEAGTIIRTKTKDIGLMSRSAKGVKIMKTDEDTKVASITKVIELKEELEENNKKENKEVTE